MSGDLQNSVRLPEATERRFLAVARNLSDLLVIVDLDGSWEMPVAAPAVEHYGILPFSDDLDALFARFHPDDVPTMRDFVHRRLSRDGTAGRVVRVRLQGADGHWRTMELSGHDMLDDPVVHGLVLHLRDITRLAATQEALRRNTAPLLTLLDSLDGGILLESRNRRIIAINQPMIEMFGMSARPEQLIGADCSGTAERASLLFRDPDHFLASVTEAISGRRPRLDEEFVLKDGRTLHRDYAPVWFNDECLGHTWAYWDVTSQKRAERQLKDQNRALAELSDMKTQFIASVSHELRTPLSAITGFTELLLTDARVHELAGPVSEAGPATAPGNGTENFTAEQREYLEAVDRNARRLLHLVNDLLFAAQMESRRLPLSTTRIDIADLARTAISERAPEAARRNIRLVTDIPDTLEINGDGSRLLQVLDNLLGNAIKFSRKGGTVTVTLRPTRPSSWQMVVADTGIGIPAKDINRLFRSFYRAGNVRSTTSGTGLGLVICRAIVERHGGQIEVDSSEGTGTTVTVTLPLQPPREEVATA